MALNPAPLIGREQLFEMTPEPPGDLEHGIHLSLTR